MLSFLTGNDHNSLIQSSITVIIIAAVSIGLIGCSDDLPTETGEQNKPGVTKVTTSSNSSQQGTPNASTVTAKAELNPMNGSGISGTVYIVDDGSTIEVVKGSATGLDPDNTINFAVPQGYLSLFYDKASAPNGPEACEPGIFAHESEHVNRVSPHPLGSEHPLFLTEAQMLGAYWSVQSDGTGSPNDLEGQYVPVEDVGTISIRDLRINGGFGPQAVVACGVVRNAPRGQMN